MSSISSLPPILDLQDIIQIRPSFEYLGLISRDLASKHQTCVIGGDHKQIDIVTTNNDPDGLKSIMQILGSQGYKITTHYTDPGAFLSCLEWYDQAEHRSSKLSQELAHKQQATGAEAIKLIYDLFVDREKYSESDFIYEIIRLAYQAGASDLHFQNEEKAVVVRLRIDGAMHDIIQFDHQEFKKYLLKIKFMSHAKMNIDYLPQDARFTFQIQDHTTTRTIDVRLSLIPGLDGESIAMRFLDPLRGLIDLHDIGFLPEQYEILTRVLDKMSGMVIITGPTGSGKTTTLYSMLRAIDHTQYKIITLEDPIEYHIPGIQQSQIDEYKGYTFETGLKAILRHDPDVIMVGEIRTLETAETAIAAAMTGHLVLCTLHTNSAIEAIQRLINMGVKPYTLIGALNVLIGQKLIHQTDPNQAQTLASADHILAIQQTIHHITQDLKLEMPTHIATESGTKDIYHGRLMVAEVFQLDDTVKQMIVEDKTIRDIQDYAHRHGYIRILDSAMIALCKGHTSREEVVRLM